MRKEGRGSKKSEEGERWVVEVREEKKEGVAGEGDERSEEGGRRVKEVRDDNERGGWRK